MSASASQHDVSYLVGLVSADAARAAYANAVFGVASAAARAAARADNFTSAQIWDGVRYDANWLVGHATAKGGPDPAALLAVQPLWVIDKAHKRTSGLHLPDQAREPWLTFKRSNLARDDGFKIWINWYEARLKGLQVGGFDQSLKGGAAEKLDIRVATQPEEFWDRDAAEVNAEIKAWIENAKGETDYMPQTPAPYSFEIEDGEIRLAAFRPDLTVSEAFVADTWATLVRTLDRIGEIRAEKTNAYVPEEITFVLETLRTDLGETSDAVRPGAIQSDWRALKRAMARLRAEHGTNSDSLDDALDAVFEGLEDLRSCYADCRRIETENIRLGITARTVDDVEKLLSDVATIVRNARPGVALPETVAATEHGLKLAAQETDKEAKADLIADQALTDRNLGAAVRNELKDFGKKTWDKTKDEVSTEIAKFAGSGTKWGLRYLAFDLFGVLENISEIVEGFKPLRDAFRKLRDIGVFDDVEDGGDDGDGPIET